MFESFFATQVRVLKKENTNLLQPLHTTLIIIEVPLSFQACDCPILIWNRIISLLLFKTAENAAQQFQTFAVERCYIFNTIIVIIIMFPFH